MSWKRSDIASLVSVVESGSRPKGGASTESGEIPSLGGENILKDGGVTLQRVKRVPRKFFERMTKGHLKDADVLINKDGAQTGKVGLYKNDNSAPACINEHLFLIRGDAPKITQSYLYYTLLSQPCQNQIDAQISGSAQPGLKNDFLNGVFAGIPEALPEQSKIAEVLSTVDRVVEQTEGLIAKQQRIKTGLMQDLLTRGIDEHGNLRSEETHTFKDSPLGRIPMEWEFSVLSHFVPSAEYGISTSLGEFGDPVLRMNNFFEGEADISDLKYTVLTVPEKLWLRDGDVLFNRTNSWEHVGRTGIWRCQVESATFASYLVRLNPDPDLLLSELLNIWLNSVPTQIAMRRFATPAVQQVNINPTNLRAIYAAFPTSLNEQYEIVNRFTRMRNTISSNVESLAKLRSLKAAMMQDLLTGEIPVTPLLEKMEIGL